ncbi:hypothetical protein M0804_013256 [Polistes exclamans]|nr:hypothetical protein M0804_013256 [Polistes exclamans]
MVDDDVHKCIKQTISDKNYSKLSYEDIISYYVRSIYDVNESFFHKERFKDRNQYEQETIEKYSYNLQKLYKRCNFKTYSKNELCDKFRSGIRCEDIKAKLTKFPKTTLASTVGMAIALEKEKVMNDFINLALSMMNIYNTCKAEKFPEWFNRFEYVANKIEIPNDKIGIFFIKMIHNDVHKLVKNNYPNINFSKLSYNLMLNYYLNYFSNNNLERLNRCRFYCRVQYDDESLEDYINNLKEIFNKCNYLGDKSKKLCKQFLNGIRCNELKNYLEENPSVSINKMAKMSTLFERIKDILPYTKQALTMINIYNPINGDEFYVWLNKFEYVADMINVPHEKMVEFFNEMVIQNVHTYVKQSLPDVNFSELSYEKTVIHYLHYFYTSEVNINIKRFMCRNQYENETIDKYANNLWKLLNKCSNVNNQDELLLKKFFNGIHDDNIRNYLKQIFSLSFEDMVEKAINFSEEKKINSYVNEALKLININNTNNGDEFYVWLNKFEYVADMINVPDEKMVKFFNKMVNQNVHRYVKQSLPDVNFSVLPYEETVNHYLRHFLPCEVDLNIKRFMCRNQYENEAIDKYANNLWKLLYKCYNGNNQDELLLQQFINGIRDDNIRNYLHNLFGLSFKEMVEKAITFSEENKINSYVNKALKMINIYNSHIAEAFFSWYNKFEYVANKIDIPNEKIGKFFIKMVHDDVHKLVKENYPNINFSRLSSNFIINYYLIFFSNNNLERLNRSRFYCRVQYDDESLENYINNLKTIFNKCNYLSDQSKKLCKQFLNGIRCNELKKYLEKNPNASINEMEKNATLFERINDILPYKKKALTMINIYNPINSDIFYVWLNKFEYVADMINVPDEKMVKFFNEMVNQNVHTYVKQSLPDVNFSELSYEETVIHYLHYFYTSKVNINIKRFMCRNQYENETIDKYYYNLKKIYDKLDDITRQKINICQKFVNGIIDDDIRSHLNNISGLSFDEIVSYVIKYFPIPNQMNEPSKTTGTYKRNK